MDGDSLIFLAVTLLVAALAILATSRLLARRDAGAPLRCLAGADVHRHYRFRAGYLISDVAADDAFLDSGVDRSIALRRLTSALNSLNPNFAENLTDLRLRGRTFLIEGRIGGDDVSIAGRVEDGDILAISVGPGRADSGRQIIDDKVLESLQSDIVELRNTVDGTDIPMWRESEAGQILWANAAYFDLAETAQGDYSLTWPIAQVFQEVRDNMPVEGTVRRCQLSLPGRDEPAWYEISCNQDASGARLCQALPVGRLVRAETTLREFMQTLTKTFATLPIGMAVFDRKRLLVTFNPAFAELTDLGPEFLTNRPDLRSVLDQLREHQKMPEPRDYRAWRDEIARLEQGAERGTYQDMWELPSGQTFRVTGRPHPDGAIAFMVEDISAEVSLTRQFRSDLALHQAVIDAAPMAMAVFNAGGTLVQTNAIYDRFWAPARSEAEDGGEPLPTLARASALWASRCGPSGLWGEIRQFVGQEVERAAWSEEVRLLDGRRMTVHMAPIRGRHTVLHFIPEDAVWADPLATLAPARLEAPTHGQTHDERDRATAKSA